VGAIVGEDVVYVLGGNGFLDAARATEKGERVQPRRMTALCDSIKLQSTPGLLPNINAEAKMWDAAGGTGV
jgi:hypothetical protein